jgi:hypothetical protein
MELKPPAPFFSSTFLSRDTRKPSQTQAQTRNGSRRTVVGGAKPVRVGEGILQGWRGRSEDRDGRDATKSDKKTMNNRSQEPRVCEGLEHGAYAKDSRIEVDDGRHEELGRREMVSFLFFFLLPIGYGLSQRPTNEASVTLQSKVEQQSRS